MARVNLNTVRYGRHEMVQFEDSAAEDIVAGYLVEKVGDGSGFQAHATDAGVPQRVLVAYEDRGVGMELHPDGADHEYSVYPAGTNMKVLQASGGAEFTLWLDGGNTVSHTDGLVSAGNGRLRPAAGDGTESDSILFEADLKADYYDSLDLTAAAGEPELVDVVLAN